LSDQIHGFLSGISLADLVVKGRQGSAATSRDTLVQTLVVS